MSWNEVYLKFLLLITKEGGQNMENKPRKVKVKIHWFWGFVGCLGVVGFILNEPGYYVFLSFFLFFLEPVLKKSKK